jgi:hypothetical protein
METQRMPYNIIEEEEEKARAILLRWQIFSITHHSFGLMIGFCCMSISNTFMSKNSPYRDIVFWIGSLLCLYGVYGAHTTLRRFVAEMTIEEIETLERAAIGMSKSEKKTIKSLVHKHGKIHPGREYLRASQPTHDDGTLLRAATHHENDTLQEQLLRPADPTTPHS